MAKKKNILIAFALVAAVVAGSGVYQVFNPESTVNRAIQNKFAQNFIVGVDSTTDVEGISVCSNIALPGLGKATVIVDRDQYMITLPDASTENGLTVIEGTKQSFNYEMANHQTARFYRITPEGKVAGYDDSAETRQAVETIVSGAEQAFDNAASIVAGRYDVALNDTTHQALYFLKTDRTPLAPAFVSLFPGFEQPNGNIILAIGSHETIQDGVTTTTQVQYAVTKKDPDVHLVTVLSDVRIGNKRDAITISFDPKTSDQSANKQLADQLKGLNETEATAVISGIKNDCAQIETTRGNALAPTSPTIPQANGTTQQLDALKK